MIPLPKIMTCIGIFTEQPLQHYLVRRTKKKVTYRPILKTPPPLDHTKFTLEDCR